MTCCIGTNIPALLLAVAFETANKGVCVHIYDWLSMQLLSDPGTTAEFKNDAPAHKPPVYQSTLEILLNPCTLPALLHQPHQSLFAYASFSFSIPLLSSSGS